MKGKRPDNGVDKVTLVAVSTGVTTKIPKLGSFDFKLLKCGRHVSSTQVANFYERTVKSLRDAELIGVYSHSLGTVAEISIIRQRYHASQSNTALDGLVHLATYGGLGPFKELKTPYPITVTPYITYKAATTPN